jgi:lysozyme
MNELDALIEIVKRFEGCRLRAYFCPAGIVTIGWGSTGPGIVPGLVWTQQQADDRLRADCRAFLRGTRKVCPGVEFGSIVAAADFAYNLGLGRLKSSTFRRKLIVGDIEAAEVQLMRWTKAGGKVLPGLVRRRRAEVALLGQ